ncbi:MAG: DUF2807 domain-containing protein [Flavobacteriaceae bacterium]|nr:DUF2807 domain-containing protein [Flavobacteriaceae bacterium]
MTLLITGCNAQKYGRIKGSGDVISATRTVGSFEKVGVSGSFDVYLVKGKEGKEGKIDIKIEDNLLDYLVTEVKDGKLKIKWKKGTNISTRKGVVLTVYFKGINAVGLSGSGDIVAKDLIKTDHFKVAVSGSGDIDLELEANTLEASVSGSGDLDLKGEVKEFSASVAGSGDISAYDLSSEKADLKVSGSGGMTLTVTKELKAKVAGSGDIKYKGNPRIEDIKVSGSGNVGTY